MTTDPVFGPRLRQAREKAVLSQSDLAKRAGLDPSAIGHFEAGRRKPSFDNIRLLATALNISTDALIGNTAVTGFRNADRLTDGDRDFIQDIINARVDKS